MIMPLKKLLRTEYTAIGLSEMLGSNADINFRVRAQSLENPEMQSTYTKASVNNKALITIYNVPHEEVGAIRRSIQRELLGNHFFNILNNDERENLVTSIVQSKADASVAPGWAWVKENFPNESLIDQSRIIFGLVAETIDLLEPAEELTIRPTQSAGIYSLQDLQKEIRICAEEIKENSRFDCTFSSSKNRQSPLEGLNGIDDISFDDDTNHYHNEDVIIYKV